ncbi:Transcriptional regulator containing GAF, AAA-type ATPase, and DNA-binding Fis domains [Desulfocicer vacuolatum DSM 3385]|uniref:Transcriptional regulator containing GAF, AAA-type ATPase, and DNA-binding Fis domains n=1 Tax=Desulfocicer vacuolatum DSM 3385 TaxID=1121400 RepID=A0A1W2EKD6_9BACT|nr:sigma 54-interacting transcriptional regulator [Desulfocicer vacuolatum]SMD09756.1 Transcriptional regulator containing GAF, AAA-type ATPase, and DNA-binding Fis domains [Desulfocicer vacuolatum DSM 3385]
MTDYDSFFRQATLKISSTLELDKALWRCLQYLKEVIPVGQMIILLYDQTQGVSEAIAYANLETYQAISIKTKFTRKMRQHIDAHRSTRVRRILNTSDDMVAQPVCKQLGCLDLSALVMDLVIEDKFHGVVSFISLPKKIFNKKHQQLVSQLNDPFAIAVTNSIHYRESQKYKELLEDDNQYLHKKLRSIGGEEVIGAEFGLKGVMDLVRQVAPMNSPVLLLGETGVGKELIAKTIHNLSLRREGPFIDVNCGAIPDSLMDSELFGHEKGSFTGAINRKRGRFERAQSGTIFLDEIGELSLEAQVRLLRVLQEKKLERLGGTESINLDIRVIAATHRNLEKMMSEGRFRQDLFFRLKVFPIIIPPLRHHKQDIPSLVQHFLHKKSVQMNLGFTPKLTTNAIDRLMSYSWPGNVRELENAVERGLILSGGKPLSFKELATPDSTFPMEIDTIHPETNQDMIPVERQNLNLNAAMARHIEKALFASQGKIDGKGGAAELLGINSRTLRHRMKTLKVPFGRNAKGRYAKPNSNL